jgi:Ni/Fe-hydrogenase subunit HybB-like protein
MSYHRGARVETPIVTGPFKALGAVAAVGALILLWRYVFGLGSVTNLSDGYPWGLWIAFDVVVGTAIACGGYAVAGLVYVMNRGRYHPLVRSAILTSALGYSLAGVAVALDVGRYWNLWKVPVMVWSWNMTSVLLEVALCIMAYTLVLWMELSPALVQRYSHEGSERARARALRWKAPVDRLLPFVIALGVLLPTMHQSSLGSLMLLAGQKLHPLWQTPLLPLLFLVSCLGMGFGGVVLEATLSASFFGRPRHSDLLRGLARPTAYTLLLYSVLRLAEVAWRGRLGMAVALDGPSLLFLTEMALFAGSGVGLLVPGLVRRATWLFRLSMIAVLAGALYRFSTFLIAYDPGGGWSYFPAVPEILATVGLVAAELMVYLVLVKTFPILQGRAPAPAPVRS